MISAQAAGRLTQAPVLRRTTGENPTAVVELRLACPKWRNAKEASYLTVNVYGEKPAANAMKYLTKGQQVMVMGHLDQQRWTKDDQERSRYVLVSERVTYGARPKDSEPDPRSVDVDPEEAPQAESAQG